MDESNVIAVDGIAGSLDLGLYVFEGIARPATQVRIAVRRYVLRNLEFTYAEINGDLLESSAP